MFDLSDNTGFDQVTDFFIGDRDNCPFSSWVHYGQCAFIGVVAFVLCFCGCRSGG